MDPLIIVNCIIFTYSSHETDLEEADQLHLLVWIHLRYCKEQINIY